MDNEVQFLIYSTAQEEVKIDVVVKDETIWLTQKSMAELFGVESNTILIIGPRVRVPEGAPKKRLKTRFLAVFYYFFVVFCFAFNYFPQFSPNQKPPFPPTWAGFSL